MSEDKPEEDVPEKGVPKTADGHYRHQFFRGARLDPYRVAQVYNIPAGPRWQILKKVLRGTAKGHTEQQVIDDIQTALDRWREMLREDNE